MLPLTSFPPRPLCYPWCSAARERAPLSPVISCKLVELHGIQQLKRERERKVINMSERKLSFSFLAWMHKSTPLMYTTDRSYFNMSLWEFFEVLTDSHWLRRVHIASTVILIPFSSFKSYAVLNVGQERNSAFSYPFCGVSRRAAIGGFPAPNTHIDLDSIRTNTARNPCCSQKYRGFGRGREWCPSQKDCYRCLN